ncbi:proton-conducting transporter membrane subunit [Ascidiimonas sp. W6]|uniref:proton-conducting transporter transmembrane domain-containing protein n=1 Tax=Ascidiimonas meishanensis TaxID=3128903 RepID=UPI0030EB93E2
MNENLVALIAIIAPLFFIITAVVSWFQTGMRPKLLKKLSVTATVVNIIIATICSFFVIQNGLLETAFMGYDDLGFSLRLDALSMLMLGMIALLGFIVVRYSLNYLDGDHRQGIFIGRLAATIASVQFLVLSGNLGLLFVSWVLTSMSLHRLLIFYRERPGAIIAARKKFILARLGDLCLFLAVILLFNQFGTGNLEIIFQQIQNSITAGISLDGIEFVALLLAGAALLKSAQFPTHGWLIEVMETPTPVSALLHAGLLNAGPFLIIRMAFVMEASVYAPLVLIVLGGFTALFASVVFLTQTSIKTALGYSSVAHMGFSLLVCGLGVYPAAMLHLVAHSFYKAHSFLSSGSVIDVIRANKITAAKRMGNPSRILLGILLALGTYTAFAFVWGIDPVNELSLLVIGAIITLGLSKIFTTALDSTASIQLILRASFMAILVTIAFFSLESAMHFLLDSQVPELVRPNFTEMVLVGVLLFAFAAVVFLQILAPVLTTSPFYSAIAVHLRNGFYINTVFDRMVRALYAHGTQTKPQVIESVDYINNQEVISIEDYQEQPA